MGLDAGWVWLGRTSTGKVDVGERVLGGLLFYSLWYSGTLVAFTCDIPPAAMPFCSGL